MVQIRYGDVIPQPGTITVASMGSQPGPVGGDGWETVAVLPSSKLPAGGPKRYCVIVTGKIGNCVHTGAPPSRGVLQLALGLRNGGSQSISPVHRQSISVTEPIGPLVGIPFMFMMLQSSSPSISDPFFGPTFTNGVGPEFALFGRAYWNGDPTAYAIQFDVTDLTWIWFETSAIPSPDQLCEAYVPSSPAALATSTAGVYLNSNQPGAEGQKWLHFHAITYEPRAAGQAAPSFQFGYSPSVGSYSGFVPKIGTNGRWGQNRALFVTGASEVAMLSQGAFWYGVQPAGTFLPAVMARDRQTLGSGVATRVHRYAYFGVRLDNLLDVLARTETEVQGATSGLVTPPFFPQVYVPLERPATGIVSQPCAMVHGIVQTQGLQAYEAVLTTNQNRTLDFLDSCAQADAARSEGVSCMAFAQQGLSRSMPDLQYRAGFVSVLNGSSISLSVRDITILQFNLVRDPDPNPGIPGSPGSPLLLAPGRESANPASLPVLPVEPDGEEAEDAALAGARVDGATGYSRTWPLFARVRRTMTLTWTGISESDGATLYAFLKANPAFRYTPKRSSTAIAVVQAERPELVRLPGGPVYQLRMQVVELVWTN